MTYTDNRNWIFEWKHVSISLQNDSMIEMGSGDSPGNIVTLQINSTTLSEEYIPIDVPSQFSSITIGEGFNGFIQDIGIDTRQPNDSSLTAAKAAFLPQCLCPDGYSLSADERNCIMGSDSIARYVIMHNCQIFNGVNS